MELKKYNIGNVHLPTRKEEIMFSVEVDPLALSFKSTSTQEIAQSAQIGDFWRNMENYAKYLAPPPGELAFA